MNSKEVGLGNEIVLFLHGNSMSSAIWKYQMSTEFLPDYRKIFIDLPGHGKSHRLHDYSLQIVAKAVDQFLREKDIKECHVVGHSYGGHLANYIQNLGNVAFKGRVFIGAIPVYLPLELDKLFLPNEAVSYLFLDKLNQEQLTTLAKVFCPENAEAQQIVKETITQTDGNFRARSGAALANPSALINEEKLLLDSEPICFLNGEHEALINAEKIGERPYSLWRNEIHFIKDAGHLNFLEQPVLFNELASQYFNEIE